MKYWDEYKQRMDEVILSRGNSKEVNEITSCLFKGMTKEEMLDKLLEMQKQVRERNSMNTYEEDDGPLTEEQLDTIKQESSATDTEESKFTERLF